MPVAEGTYTISRGFGVQPDGEDHKGIDYAANAGTPIYAAADGTVVAAGAASGFGDWIVIDSVDETGAAFSTVYGHMYDNGMVHADGTPVTVGEKVSAGQQIAVVGSNGESSGPHLHFELVPGGRLTGGKQIDPMPWLSGAATTSGGGTGANSGGGGTTQSCPSGFGTPGGQLKTGKVPAELEQWYRKAGSMCPEISASLLAAQGEAESGFRTDAVSPDGAEGVAQFMPGTAKSLAPDGQPYIRDETGKGYASAMDPADAIMGQGRYMCALAQQIKGWESEGKVSGDVVALAVAAYNAGPGAVLESGGMPNQIPRHFTETRPYVERILAAEPGFREASSNGRFVPTPGTALGSQTVSAARQWIGLPYVWGGGGTSGPSNGGFDCSGLTSAAVYAASNGTVTLPRTSEQQWSVGVEVSMDQVQAGDLVFSEFDSGTGLPGHVAIATGDGHVIQAPQSGQNVSEAAMPSNGRARRVM
ncbi:peptidoglycan DD-metalloendopeptidase family protein [Nocardia yamanashiensis]|uniref:peptidoglycan DD-metalloendopeptidase family protein n=1 Tax=Nocardia yamanashiensis TaxID=209247 RepID=UPI001F363C64|nr:peptidoglycan DD-metalloendopeptidase family protein [Nocardia yamanashiensis]